MTTRQSEKSRQTDAKIALSAARAVRTVGVDQMALTRVAADAGFSSGAIYARCDDRSELVVLAWERCFWPMLESILAPALDGVLDCDPVRLAEAAERMDEHTRDDATPDLGSAMEVLVASRRDEVVGEVVQRDVAALLSSRGVGPSTEGARRQAAIATVAAVCGAGLINSAYSTESHGRLDPVPLLAAMSEATRNLTTPASATRTVASAPPPFERPTTRDELRDELLAATEWVISRSGIHRATISRIARRAGASVGAIYGLYDNKDALVRDCVEVLFPPQTRRDVENWSKIFTAGDPGPALSAIIASHMSAERQSWRRFRLECLVAARHSPALARQLAGYADFARRNLVSAMEHRVSPGLVGPDASVSSRSIVTGLALVEIADPTVVGLDWRWVPLR